MRGRPIGKPLAPASTFDYEAKRWGAGALRPKPWFMNGLKLRYLLEDLVTVRGRALDVGCGAGQVAKAVKRERPDLEVLACDVSRSAIAAASSSADGVDFRLATAERLPFAEPRHQPADQPALHDERGETDRAEHEADVALVPVIAVLRVQHRAPV